MCSRRHLDGRYRPLKLDVRRPSVMRVLALICAIVAAALTTLAAFAVISTILERTDRESLIGAFFLLCVATPFSLIAVSLSLLNRRKWPLFQVVGSLSVFAFFSVTWVLWAVVNH
jgi:hypothetical protein